jgi:hypothetical protein
MRLDKTIHENQWDRRLAGPSEPHFVRTGETPVLLD